MSDTNTSWTVMTGSTGGIGTHIARRLASHGNALVFVNRSEAKTKAQTSQLLADYPGLRIATVIADLMEPAQVSRATDEILDLPGRIDTLYNNSGILTADKVLNSDGLESQFVVNTLAPYQLIRGLRTKMARPKGESPAMVVNFSSSAVNATKSLDLDNLARPERVGGLMTTYAQTKLAVTTLAPALAKDLGSDNILIRAVDPGATKTAMTTGNNSGMPRLLRWLAPLLFSSPAKQAGKVVESADPAAHNGGSGIFVANRRERRLPAPAADAKNQHDLVTLLESLLGQQSTQQQS